MTEPRANDPLVLTIVYRVTAGAPGERLESELRIGRVGEPWLDLEDELHGIAAQRLRLELTDEQRRTLFYLAEHALGAKTRPAAPSGADARHEQIELIGAAGGLVRWDRSAAAGWPPAARELARMLGEWLARAGVPLDQ